MALAARPTRALPLRNRAGEVVAHALVDGDRYSDLAQWRWSLKPGGYAKRNIPREWGAVAYLHRVVMGCRPGDGLEVDHISHDKLDNRRSNLRIVTRQQNAQNQIGGWGVSKYRGVTYHPNRSGGKWRAQAALAGRRYMLGHFETEEEAAAIAAAWRAEHMPFSREAA